MSVGTELVALADSLGRVLAEDLVSAIRVPPFANSAMDGFALRAKDVPSVGTELRVTGVIAAGASQLVHVHEGEAVRIMTGAPLPPGADAVVPLEVTVSSDDRVTINTPVREGACIRPAGLDVNKGDVVLSRGVEMGSARIALAASIGAAQFLVHRKPVVAIVATGDELVEPGQPLPAGKIYNSNAYGLAAAVRALGATPRVFTPARDEPEALRSTLCDAAGQSDLILTSGGVSVGDYDYVRMVIQELGQVDFWRVRMRPGKPLMLGAVELNGSVTPVLGLPGNPTSTMVTFFVFARPWIMKLMGHSNPLPSPITVVAADQFDNRGGRETYFRVKVTFADGEARAHLAGGQDSSMLRPLAEANALARVPFDKEEVKSGDRIDVFLL